MDQATCASPQAAMTQERHLRPRPSVDLVSEMREGGARVLTWYCTHGWEGLAWRLALDLLVLEDLAPLVGGAQTLHPSPITDRRQAYYAHLKTAGAHRPRRAIWTKATTLTALHLWVQEQHRWPRRLEQCPAHGLPNTVTIRDLWGSMAAWREAYTAQYGVQGLPPVHRGRPAYRSLAGAGPAG